MGDSVHTVFQITLMDAALSCLIIDYSITRYMHARVIENLSVFGNERYAIELDVSSLSFEIRIDLPGQRDPGFGVSADEDHLAVERDDLHC